MECAGNWLAGIFSFSVPLTKFVLLFSLVVSARGPRGLVGWTGGGVLELGPTKEVPSLRYEDRVRDTTSSRVEEPLMMGLPLPTR